MKKEKALNIVLSLIIIVCVGVIIWLSITVINYKNSNQDGENGKDFTYGTYGLSKVENLNGNDITPTFNLEAFFIDVSKSSIGIFFEDYICKYNKYVFQDSTITTTINYTDSIITFVFDIQDNNTVKLTIKDTAVMSFTLTNDVYFKAGNYNFLCITEGSGIFEKLSMLSDGVVGVIDNQDTFGMYEIYGNRMILSMASGKFLGMLSEEDGIFYFKGIACVEGVTANFEATFEQIEE